MGDSWTKMWSKKMKNYDFEWAILIGLLIAIMLRACAIQTKIEAKQETLDKLLKTQQEILLVLKGEEAQ